MPDPSPHGVPVEITAIEHLIGTFRGLDPGISRMPLNEQDRGAPDVEVKSQ